MTRDGPAARWQLLASGLAFGLMAALVRLACRTRGGFSAPQVSTLRFALGCLVMLALFRARRGTFQPARPGLLVTRGVLGGAAAVLYFVALAHIPAAEATLINNTFPILATLVSIRTLGERPTFHLGVGLAVVALGVALVVGPGTPGAGLGVGELAAAGAALAAGLSVTSIRALRTSSNAPTIFFAFCAGGLACSLPLSGGGWPVAPAAWLFALAAALLATAGQLLMTSAYGALTVAEAALWQQLTPVAAYGWAVGLLDEALSPLAVAGMVVGVAGVAYGTAFGRQSAGATPAMTAGRGA